MHASLWPAVKQEQHAQEQHAQRRSWESSVGPSKASPVQHLLFSSMGFQDEDEEIEDQEMRDALQAADHLLLTPPPTLQRHRHQHQPSGDSGSATERLRSSKDTVHREEGLSWPSACFPAEHDDSLPSFSNEEMEMLVHCVVSLREPDAWAAAPQSSTGARATPTAEDDKGATAAPSASVPCPAGHTIARCGVRRKSTLKPGWSALHQGKRVTQSHASPSPSAPRPRPVPCGPAAAADTVMGAMRSPTRAEAPSNSSGGAGGSLLPGSDQDSARSARGGAAKAASPAPVTPTTGELQRVAHNVRQAARRRLLPNDSGITRPRSPGDAIAGLEFLPTDMKEELAALEEALALPTSKEELPDGPLTELEKELLNGLRKRGKGGRNQAADARLDPNIDPKKATRIMANRQSAARSKAKQRLLQEGQRIKLDMLAQQRTRLTAELARLTKLCGDMEAAGRKSGELPAPMPVDVPSPVPALSPFAPVKEDGNNGFTAVMPAPRAVSWSPSCSPAFAGSAGQPAFMPPPPPPLASSPQPTLLPSSPASAAPSAVNGLTSVGSFRAEQQSSLPAAAVAQLLPANEPPLWHRAAPVRTQSASMAELGAWPLQQYQAPVHLGKRVQFQFPRQHLVPRYPGVPELEAQCELEF